MHQRPSLNLPMHQRPPGWIPLAHSLLGVSGPRSSLRRWLTGGLPAKRPNVLRIAGAGLAQKGRAAPQITGHVSLDEAKLTVVYSADAGSYPGQAVTTPSGDSSACDPSPAWGHPAIDINISEISRGIIDKIHFP